MAGPSDLYMAYFVPDTGTVQSKYIQVNDWNSLYNSTITMRESGWDLVSLDSGYLSTGTFYALASYQKKSSTDLGPDWWFYSAMNQSEFISRNDSLQADYYIVDFTRFSGDSTDLFTAYWLKKVAGDPSTSTKLFYASSWSSLMTQMNATPGMILDKIQTWGSNGSSHYMGLLRGIQGQHSSDFAGVGSLTDFNSNISYQIANHNRVTDYQIFDDGDKNRWYLTACRPDNTSTSRLIPDLTLDSLQTTIDAQNQAGFSLAKVIHYTSK